MRPRSDAVGSFRAALIWTVTTGLLAEGAFGQSRPRENPLGSSVLASESALGLPVRVRAINDSMLGVVSATEPFVHLVRRANGAIVQSLGRKGQGRGGVWGLRDVRVSPGDTTGVWLYDLGSRRLSHRRILIGSRIDPSADSTIVLPAGHILEAPVWLTRTQLLAYAPTETSSVVVQDTRSGRAVVKGQPVMFAGATSANVSLSEQARAAADVRLCQDSKYARVIRAFRFAGRIDALDYSGQLALTFAVPDAFEPVFRPLGRAFRFATDDDNIRIGYAGCTLTPRWLVALWSGRGASTVGVARAGLGSEFHVFDRETGALVGRVPVDREMSSIQSDLACRTIFGSVPGPTPMIVAYSIAALDLALGPADSKVRANGVDVGDTRANECR